MHSILPSSSILPSRPLPQQTPRPLPFRWLSGALVLACLVLAPGGESAAQFPRLPKLTSEQQLYKAAGSGNLTKVKRLIQKGANVNAVPKTTILPPFVNTFGETALHKAAQNGHTAVVTALLDADALINKRSRLIKQAALHYAAHNGHDATVTALLDAGARVNL